MIDLKIETRDIERMQTFLDGFGVEAQRALARTINRVAVGIKTDGARSTRQIFNVKARTLRQSFLINRASVNQGLAMVLARGKPEPLSEYGARTSNRGVSVLVKRSAGRASLRHAFLGSRQYKGKQTIVERQTESRLPLKTLYGPSIAQMLGNPAVLRAIETGAPERFYKNFNHEIQRVLTKERR